MGHRMAYRHQSLQVINQTDRAIIIQIFKLQYQINVLYVLKPIATNGNKPKSRALNILGNKKMQIKKSGYKP